MNRNKFLPEWYEENWELEEDLASLLKKRAQDKKADELGKEVELHWAGHCFFIPKKSAIKLGKYPLVVDHGSRIEFTIAKGSWEDIYKMLIRRLGYNPEELIYFKDDEMTMNKRLAIYSDGHIGIIQHPEEKQLGFFSGEDYDIMRTAVDTLFKKDRHLACIYYLSDKGVEDYNTLIKALKQLDNEEFNVMWCW